MGIQTRLVLVPLSAALFGAGAVQIAARLGLPAPLPSASLFLMAAAGAIAAGIPAAILCFKWCRTRIDLRQREARFDSIWESRLIGLYIAGSDGTIGEANPAFLAMTGYNDSDLRAGIPIRDLTPSEYREREMADRERFEREGRIGPFERDWVRKDGGRFTGLAYFSRPDGNSELAMILDIADWKATRRELLKRESRYRDLLSSRLIGIFVVDLQGRIREANDTFLGMVHRNRAELEAGILTSQSMATPEWLNGAEARRDQFLVEGSIGPIEREWVLHDGTSLHTLFFVTRMEESGKALCMAIDAGELRQTRMKLHAVETRYKNLFDSNIVGIAIVDGNQVFVDANETFLSMVGYDRSDLSEGRLTSYVLRQPDAQREQDGAEASVRGAGRLLPRETVYMRKDGTRLPVFRGVTRLEEPNRYLLIAIDLTSLREDLPAIAASRARNGRLPSDP